MFRQPRHGHQRGRITRAWGRVTAAVLGLAAMGSASAQDGREASQFVPVENEPPAELSVEPTLPGPLARGSAVVPYRTRHFRVLPIFGAGALEVSPRAGHLHVGVDKLPWRWADAGGNGSVVVNGLPAGPHTIHIELALPDHTVVAAGAVHFTVPASGAFASRSGACFERAPSGQRALQRPAHTTIRNRRAADIPGRTRGVESNSSHQDPPT